jgi:uncharacterized protein (TIGR00661 family)
MAPTRPKVLIAPLDWGLGHATRCIPIINELLAAHCEVIIAASGAQNKLLAEEFPSLKRVDLPGYNVKFSTKRGLTFLKIVLQIPKILIQIKRESRWLNNILALERPDLVISDNRYGLHQKGICSVFVTHQLQLKTGLGKFTDLILSSIHRKMISRFSICWVPDFPGEASLAGEMSGPSKLPSMPIRYIGILSRFKESCKEAVVNEILVILSGPEPQRSILENKILAALTELNKTAIILRGIPEANSLPLVAPSITMYNHLSSAEFQRIICQSALVISRSGYSTIMDLARLGKKSILIPTPGQGEQEWLGKHLAEKRIAFTVTQCQFDLGRCLEIASTFPFERYQEREFHLLRQAVKELLEKIQANQEDLG